ncbi:TetR/AcrR family transcriptional regulator [Paenibacillus sp. GCM10023252]|uniref:TetR/AcrR family transcriptional regulator n=1 Tax=Paenibacillus sp. GCM10023252 TaxID=3252649 RepID=UPI003615821A
MMHIDRRIVRTKRLLRSALAELMEEKGFDSITVSDLTERADLNRTTFYLHYRDKFDLLEQSENEIIDELEQLQSKVKDMLPTVLRHPEQVPEQPILYLSSLLAYMEDNADFIKVVLGQNGNPAFQVKIKEVMRKNMLSNLTTLLQDRVLPVPPEYFTSFISSACLGVIQQWLDNNRQQTAKEIASFLFSSIYAGVFRTANLLDD